MWHTRKFLKISGQYLKEQRDWKRKGNLKKNTCRQSMHTHKVKIQLNFLSRPTKCQEK